MSENTQEQGTRTRLDIVLAMLNYGLPLTTEDYEAIVALAQACRDGAYAVEQAQREYEAQWMVKHAESIKAIIEALAPLLQPIDAPEGDEAEAGGV